VAIGPRQIMAWSGVDQEADRHDLHAVVFHRLHGLAVRLSGRPLMPIIIGWLGP
jgi:hypothetical protein